jgi:ABC-2 type transport system permease protein
MVTHDAPAKAFDSEVDRSTGGSLEFATHVFAVADAEFLKLRNDPIELLLRAAQPLLWLLIFGRVMGQVRGLTVGPMSYVEFLAPGVLAQSVLFAAIFYGIAAIWERDLGIIHRYLVSPASRTALIMGKQLSSSIRGLAQAVIVYFIAIVLGLSIDFNPAKILGVVVLIALGSAVFSTFSLIVACSVRSRERFMGIGQVITMPIFFASNAIYPLDLMPRWLKMIARFNPLTYEVDGLRMLMLRVPVNISGLIQDISVLVAASAILLIIAARLYPRMAA